MASNYDGGEAALLALIQTVTGFTSANSSRGKWGQLNTGKASVYCILKPGRFGPRSFRGITAVHSPWSTIVQVWQRYTDDGTSLTNLEAAVEGIIAKIDANPHLGQPTIVQDSLLVSGEPVQEMWTKGGGPAWLMWEFTVTWTEESIVTFA
jgi:hypothetical protein